MPRAVRSTIRGPGAGLLNPDRGFVPPFWVLVVRTFLSFWGGNGMQFSFALPSKHPQPPPPSPPPPRHTQDAQRDLRPRPTPAH
eukprot:1264979-Rhodomonas_salina.2